MTQLNYLQLTAVSALALWFLIGYLLTMKRLVMDAYISRSYSQQMVRNHSDIDDISPARNFLSMTSTFSDSTTAAKDNGSMAATKSIKPFLGYVVLSSDHHFEYLFSLPIVVLSWRRLGIDSLVLLIGTKEQYELDRRLKFIFGHLKKLKVRLFFLHSTLADTSTLAQVGRLFAAAFEGVNLPDSTILITADADMVSFNSSNHIPNLQGGKEVFLYNSACCGSMRHDSENDTYSHIPMNTIAMTVKLWREVMGIAPNSLTSGDQIASRLYAEFGKEMVTGNGGKGSPKWHMDQNFISSLLHRWIGKRKNNQLLIDEKQRHGLRYDRDDWPMNFEGETLDNKDDAHLLHPLYGSFWNRTVGLLKHMFNATELKWCTDYRDKFLTLACPSCFSRLPVFAMRFLLAVELFYFVWHSDLLSIWDAHKCAM